MTVKLLRDSKIIIKQFLNQKKYLKLITIQIKKRIFEFTKYYFENINENN